MVSHHYPHFFFAKNKFMFKYDIVLLTEDRFFEPLVETDYIKNILLDDKILTGALVKQGLRVTRKSWSDPDFDWTSTQYAFFRTTWDYFVRFDEFQQWLNTTSKQTTFINSLELVKWNMDKHYFIDLNNNGIHTVETHFVEKGSNTSLTEIFQSLNIENCIVKPAVSGTARHTYRLNKFNVSEHESIFKKLIGEEAMLLQPFQNEIIEKGEVAMMVIGGKFTHAVLKKTKQGDFRVQDDFGGTLHEYHPSKEEITFAENAVLACPELPLYARVDILRDNNGELAIMELEIIEPEMWFRRNPEAADVLAVEIKRTRF